MRGALAAAIAASGQIEIVKSRGHRVDGIEVPIIVDGLESLKKTSELEKLFSALKLEKEIARSSEKHVRAGRGKMRGRVYRKKKGPLLVVSDSVSLMRAAGNFSGIDVSSVKNLNPELLAPGTHAGRLTIWSAAAIKELEKF